MVKLVLVLGMSCFVYSVVYFYYLHCKNIVVMIPTLRSKLVLTFIRLIELLYTQWMNICKKQDFILIYVRMNRFCIYALDACAYAVEPVGIMGMVGIYIPWHHIPNICASIYPTLLQKLLVCVPHNCKRLVEHEG